MLSAGDLKSLLAVPYEEQLTHILQNISLLNVQYVQPVAAKVFSVFQAQHARFRSTAEWGIQHLQPNLHDLLPRNVNELSAQSAIMFVALGIILLGLLYMACPRSRSTGSQDLHKPLNALMAIITPNSSLWSTTYLRVARKGTRSRHRMLSLALRDLRQDYIGGKIEFRPSAGLPDLMRDTFQTDGWRVRLHASASWRIRVIALVAVSYLGRFVPRVRPTLPVLQQSASPRGPDMNSPSRLDTSLEDARVEQTTHSQAWVTQNSATGGRAMLNLDAIPYSRIHAYIRAFQASLPPDTPVLLGFSTLDSSISVFSASFSVAAVPFLTRSYTTFRHSPRSGRASSYLSTSWTVMPLLTSVNNILQELTSGPSPLVVESVQNVSDQYANYLHQHVHDLTNDPGTRARFVGRWSMEGWREERFLTIWEEALCRAGILTRWVIFARK